MKKQIELTKEGFEALQGELGVLVEEKRPKVVERLERARNEGDLSENSDYISAREELEFLDGKIDELKHVVGTAVIISNGKSENEGNVAVGTKVTIKVNNLTHTYDIVGEWEADPVNKKISHTSPLGQALVNKKIGETVEVDAPAGKVTYEILKVE